ncbi:unnamed protein product [Trichogramma brassicae]|uniref:Uncharacterized protein n=1 Tax=Trichogramma brassicae TaxID=86971 RepID=A0A6H5IRA3_9HYME|nr:unnamed protein product [Trichogramma brassicae]
MEKTYAKMRSKLASIYWPDSVDSSIGSSGSAGSSSGNANGSRNYVDPWDLENYAYIRRHSVALPPPPEEIIQQQPIYQTTRRRRAGSRYAGPSDTDLYDSNYQYAAAREPGYHAPGSVEEIYFGSSDLTATLRRAAATATTRKNRSSSSGSRLYDYSRRPPLAEPTQPIYETRRELLQLDDGDDAVDYEDEFACAVGVGSSHYDTPLPLYAKLSAIIPDLP